MKSFWSRMGSQFNKRGVLIKRKRKKSHVKRHIHAHRVNGMWRLELPATRQGANYKKLPGVLEQTLPWYLMREALWTTLWFQMSSLQNHEIIYFCCSKSPDMWHPILRKLRQRGYIINPRSHSISRAKV